MELDDVLKAAVERASALKTARLGDDVLSRFREDAQQLFAEIQEPPLYPRSNDPARVIAERLLPRSEELLARAWALCALRPSDASLQELASAVRAHVEALVHTANGQLLDAEVSWREARAHERRAQGVRRLWARSGEEERAVFDRATGSSRYDPRPESQVTVKLPCPNPSCRRANVFQFSGADPTQRFTCPDCHTPFSGYFAEVEALQISDTPRGQKRHYSFQVEELSGARARVELEDPSGTPFPIARRDLLALLYGSDAQLAGLLNLTTGQLLWIARATGPCFLATAVYGEQAPELHAFRAFRDRALLKSVPGRWLVRGYYAVGPQLAREVGRRPRIARGTRRALDAVHGWLVERGYR